MAADLYQEDLDFLEEAKEAFTENVRLETYRNKDETHIALRYGLDRDCIHVYKLGENLLFANNILNRAPQLIVGESAKSGDFIV